MARLQSGSMSDLIVLPEDATYRVPSIAALTADAPGLRELFSFMSEAELRVQSLRMRIRDRVVTARGEELTTVEIALRHPGHARVVRRRGEDPMSRDYDIWITDGEHVKTYDAAGNRASIRPMRRGVAGADRPDLPAFSASLHPPDAPATGVGRGGLRPPARVRAQRAHDRPRPPRRHGHA